MKQHSSIDFLLHLADNALILSQRNAEWCGHGPVLEQDIAITNISLDLLGQARNFYQYAAQLLNEQANTNEPITEDSLAYLRKEREFKNCLLTELPRGDWAQTILRQFLFSNYQNQLMNLLKESDDSQIAAIAEKSLKEITYHLRWSAEWVIRLGDGTEESRARMEKAISEQWPYTGEMFIAADYEKQNGIDPALLQSAWMEKVKEVFEEATLAIPANTFMHTGGKQGVHTEHLGYILTELQYMQRAYPGAAW
ncbi:MAG TPA: 1,2-phenylacetyl-CoA epoxidase subunit PaaC [Chitinophagaceae bacterium]